MNLYSNWEELNRLIDKALELAEEERNAFLETECSGQPELLADAREYIRSIEKAEKEEFLEDTISARAGFIQKIREESLHDDDHHPATILGQQIGHYKIVKELGEGGMGSVYLAERADGEFEQQVAIKFLRGYYSPSMRNRFRREKQILARLNHPNIAGLLDGGITDDGTPYMIMEYVEGLPVDSYCTKHSLKLKERLGLFLQIYRAVQHAHSKLVIHRDLKPQNIFVTEDGRVKVMDFGIGKFLDAGLDDEAIVQTREGHHVASVEFAAPEQFRPGDPTTATDVYGLGVLLYLLLTGEKPFVFKGKSLTEIEKAVQSEPPPYPSRHANPAIGPIPHDLESIILKALRKEPEQRYETVREFIDDLQRFIGHQPVHARKGSVLYRTKKFIYRNGVVLAAASVILILASVFLTYHLQTINRHVEQTEMEAETARSVTNFIVDLFDVSDPIENEDRVLTATALLERGQLRFEDQDINPEVQLELLASLGKASMQLGNYVNAINIFSKADSVARVYFEQDSWQTATASLHLGTVLTSHRYYIEGEEHLKDAVFFFEQYSDRYPKKYIELMLQLGTSLQNTGRVEEALEIFEQGLEASRTLNPDSRKTLTFELKLGQTYWALEQNEAAEQIYFSLLEKIETNGYQRYDIYRSVLNSIGHIYRARGDHSKAQDYFTRAVEDAIAIYGNLHPHTLGLKHHQMFQYVYQNEYEKAIKAAHDMMEAYVIRHTKYSIMMGKANHHMGTIYYATGDFENAKRHYRQAVSLFEDLYGHNHHRTAKAQLHLSYCLIQEGRIDEGNELFDTAVSILESPELEFDFLSYEMITNYLLYFEKYNTEALAPKFERVRQLTYSQTNEYLQSNR